MKKVLCLIVTFICFFIQTISFAATTEEVKIIENSNAIFISGSSELHYAGNMINSTEFHPNYNVRSVGFIISINGTKAQA